MDDFVDGGLFRIADEAPKLRDLFTAEDSAALEVELLRRLESLPPGGLIVVDFDGVRVASDAARQLLARALRRIGKSGELADRYLVVTRLGKTWYNVQVMLEKESLTVVERPDEGTEPRLVGRSDPAVKETYEFVARQRLVSAKDVKERFAQSIQAATNRLTKLFELGLARRVGEEPASGGGRQYIYAAVR